MKLLIVFIIASVAINYNTLLSTETFTLPRTDSIPDSLFYGLTAQEITIMEIAEIKEFCATKKIPLSQFVLTRTKGKNYLLKQKAKRDSMEVVKIYEQIDKRLDIDK